MAANSLFTEPENEQEMAEQAVYFISKLFRPDECFELVLQGYHNGKDKYIPHRSKENIMPYHPGEKADLVRTFKEAVGNLPYGAWICLNPVSSSEELKGSAPSDQDVTDYRYALIESDSLSRQEQWEQLSSLNLPILCVTWSGSKSLHAIVKIEAGKDYSLYKERITKLYRFLDEHNFPVDNANKNPSRLTRIPGFYRDGSKQYLFAGESGPKSWLEFEQSVLSEGNTNKAPVQESWIAKLTESYGDAFYTDKNGVPNVINQSFFAAYTIHNCNLKRDQEYWRQYQADSGLWRKLENGELLKLISQQLLHYSRQNHVPLLAAKRSANLCRDISTFMAGEQIGLSVFQNKRRNVIHAGNGMVEISP